MFGVGSGIGPLVGGAICTYISWHWVFYINVPIAVICFLLTVRKFPSSEAKELKRIDYFGISVLTLLILDILLYFQWIGGETRVHSDYSVISSEFVCFLSSIMSSRIVKRFDSAGSLDSLSYGKSMAVLERAKKVRIDGKWNLVRMTVKDSEILTDLGLIPKIIEVKNPRGRPCKKRY